MATIKHEITPANLTVDKSTVLGVGGAGSVYKGTLRVASGVRDVAVKELDDVGAAREDGEAPREYTLLRAAMTKCTHVCRPLGYCQKEGKTCLVLKLYSGSLFDHLQQLPGAPLPFHRLDCV